MFASPPSWKCSLWSWGVTWIRRRGGGCRCCPPFDRFSDDQRLCRICVRTDRSLRGKGAINVFSLSSAAQRASALVCSHDQSFSFHFFPNISVHLSFQHFYWILFFFFVKLTTVWGNYYLMSQFFVLVLSRLLVICTAPLCPLVSGWGSVGPRTPPLRPGLTLKRSWRLALH